MKTILSLAAILFTSSLFCQKTYSDSLREHRMNYIQNHGVLKGHDKSHIAFFSLDEKYRVLASIELTPNTTWFKMESSGPRKDMYRVYGTAKFKLDEKEISLNIYQNQDLLTVDQYKNYLFIPYADATSGKESYEGGKYIDLEMKDIQNGKLVIDFNKAYNPYCAYVAGVYSCPIPPKENRLTIEVKAGEEKFSNAH